MLTAPTGLAVQGTPTQTAITVGWSASVGAADYLVTRTPGNITQAVTGLTAAFTGLTANTQYTFTVKSRAGTSTSPASSGVQISTAT